MVNNSLFGMQNYKILIQVRYRQTTGSANGFELKAYVFGSAFRVDTNLRRETALSDFQLRHISKHCHQSSTTHY